MMAEFPGWETQSVFPPWPDLPVLCAVDIAVIGGGAAGVAAAITAAESGKSVILVEKYGFCGGAAVAGLSGTMCGLYLASDRRDKPEQLVFGFAERFRAALASRNGVTAPQIYGKTFAVTHDPLVWRETADALLRDAGVRLLFHSSVIGVVAEADVLLGVVVASKAGRSVIAAHRIIDCSGDAAVVARAGLPTLFGADGQVQNPTMIFRLGNVDFAAFTRYWGADTMAPAKVVDAIAKANSRGSYDLPRSKIWIFPTTRPGELLVNATRLTAPDGGSLNMIDPEQNTRAEIGGRRQVRNYARFLREHVPGCEQSFVADTGVEVGIRQTRTIVGRDILRDADVVEGRKRQDGICRVPWPIELHDGEKPRLHWLLDDYYEVPFRSLIPAHAENLLVAGRCLSAEHRALASARVTAPCFEYGQAAGLAAALSIDLECPPSHLDGAEIRAEMIGRGSALS